jgi:hypothetical protein
VCVCGGWCVCVCVFVLFFFFFFFFFLSRDITIEEERRPIIIEQVEPFGTNLQRFVSNGSIFSTMMCVFRCRRSTYNHLVKKKKEDQSSSSNHIIDHRKSSTIPDGGC